MKSQRDLKILPKHQLGMTLIEVMVALAVFAIVGITIMGSVNHTIQGQNALENKSIALWIADNTLTDLKLKAIFPDLGWQSKSIEYGDQTWYVRWQGVNTPEPQLRALDVEVSLVPFRPDSKPEIIASLRTYVIRQS